MTKAKVETKTFDNNVIDKVEDKPTVESSLEVLQTQLKEDFLNLHQKVKVIYFLEFLKVLRIYFNQQKKLLKNFLLLKVNKEQLKFLIQLTQV